MTETKRQPDGGYAYRKRGSQIFFEETREKARALTIGTPEKEYLAAKEKQLYCPEAGLPDYDAILKVLGLSRENLP